MKKYWSIILMLLMIPSIQAQKGFRIEASIGPTIGDSRELYSYSYTLQGNLYYLWNVSKHIDIGATTGALVFLGGNTTDIDYGFDYGIDPDLYLPVAIAGRSKISKDFSMGLDTGYAFYIHIFDDVPGGIYLRPLIAYHIKRKLSFIASYSSVFEKGYTASTVNFGINIGFLNRKNVE